MSAGGVGPGEAGVSAALKPTTSQLQSYFDVYVYVKICDLTLQGKMAANFFCRFPVAY
jgi:hypothetical protein